MMNEDRLWYVDGDTVAKQIQRIQHRAKFLLDETVETWQLG